MSDVDWNKIAAEVEGTTLSPGAIADRYDLDVEDDEVELALAAERVEVCVGCGWWFHERVGATGDPLCDECRTTSEAER